MALRVTQQSVDVLSEATGGKLRVTQFYVEVLGVLGTNVSASDTITLTDVATEVVDYARVVTDSLGITDLSDFGTEVSAASSMALTDQVNQQFDLSLASVIAFADVADCDTKSLSVVDTMTLTDTATPDRKELSVAHSLGLTDVVTTNFYSVSSVLALTDSATQRQIELSASNVMVLSDGAALASPEHTPGDPFTLTDTITTAIDYARAAASTMALVQSVEIFIDRTGTLCIYSPFVGTGPYTFTATPPTLTPSQSQLFWPLVSPSLIVNLRNPEFGNKITLNMNRINRKSRGGTKQVYRKPTWPRFRMLDMQFSMLNQTQVNGLKAFLTATLGLVVGFRDHDGRLWQGVIMTPDIDITQVSGTITCPNYATSFQFEGELM